MKTILLILAFATQAYAAVPAWQVVGSTATGTSTAYLAGTMKVYSSTAAAAAAPGITLNGPTATVTATSFAGTASTATNLAGGAAGQVPMQSAAGATTFTTPTSANTASTLVKRDASGNFSAGTITASLSGNATTATTATNVQNTDAGGQSLITAINSATSGTVNWARVNKTGSNLSDMATRSHTVLSDIGTNTHATVDTHLAATGATHGATAANTASQIVLRDASGNFTAGTITATRFSGPLTGAVTGNADTATTSTNLKNGVIGNIPYQTGANATSFVAAGSLGYVLTGAGAAIPTWTGTASANTANTLVKRDASGNFSAGTITATLYVGALNGNANTATTATSATTATNLANGAVGNIPYQSAAGATSFIAPGTAGYVLTGAGSAIPTWTNATNANTASTLVKRDTSGNFSAGTVNLAQLNINDLPMIRTSGGLASLHVGSYQPELVSISAALFGSRAGERLNNTATESTFIGASAGCGAIGGLTGVGNTAVGTSAGSALSSGADNVLIGKTAGDSLTTGSRNIIIGSGADASAGANDYLNIADKIYGTMTAGSTVTFIPAISAPKFYGDGSGLTNLPAGDAVLASTQTFTGANTFISSITSTGNNSWTGTNSFSGDTTLSGPVTLPTRDKITFGNELANSSSTIILTYTVAQSAFSNCVTGSTLTITTNGGRAMVGFSGNASSTAGGQAMYSTYKVDGVTATLPIVKTAFTTAGYELNMSFLGITAPLSAGSHQFCLAIRNSGAPAGTVSWDSNNQFWVQELR